VKALSHQRRTLQETVAALEATTLQTLKVNDNAAMESIDELRELLSRYQRREQGLERILEIYRRGILSLFADGSWYNAIHFNAFLESTTASSSHGGWIEKEVAVVRSCLVADNQTLERFCHSLHLRVRQLESYSSELRLRLEETLKEMYAHRHGRGDEDPAREQLKFLSVDLKLSKAQVLPSQLLTL
jgi:hypothetical protein